MTFDLYTYSDGGARGNPGPAACGAVLADSAGKILHEEAKLLGETTNNVAEYNGMILALSLAQARGAKRLLCTSDSQLIVFQLQGKYRIKDLRLKGLAEKVQSLIKSFDHVTLQQVGRAHPMITRADAVLNKALDGAPKSAHRPTGQGRFF